MSIEIFNHPLLIESILVTLSCRVSKNLQNGNTITRTALCCVIAMGATPNFLGIPGDFSSSIYLDAIKRIVEAGKKNNKSLGIMINNKDELEMYTTLGFNMIAVGTEMNILTRSISEIIS